MAALVISVPKEYGYVVAAAGLSFAVATWHGMKVGSYRKAAKTPYPRPFALDTWSLSSSSDPKLDKETVKAQYLFNCAQRGHGQFNEHYPIFLAGLLISGVQYPLTSAVLGVAWCFNRVLFMNGYLREDKEKGAGRYQGMGYLLSELGYLGLVGKTAFDMIMA